MDDFGTAFVEFGLGNPHIGEGAKSGEDGASDPDRESTFGGSENLD